jgi:hypothetical protein
VAGLQTKNHTRTSQLRNSNADHSSPTFGVHEVWSGWILPLIYSSTSSFHLQLGLPSDYIIVCILLCIMICGILAVNTTIKIQCYPSRVLGYDVMIEFFLFGACCVLLDVWTFVLFLFLVSVWAPNGCYPGPS